MTPQRAKPAILSKTLQFLAAGGITLIGGILQEALKPNPDWGVIASMVAGALIGIGGGAYGRIVAQGPLTSIVRPQGAK